MKHAGEDRERIVDIHQMLTEKKERKKSDLNAKAEDLKMPIHELTKVFLTLKSEIAEMQVQLKRANGKDIRTDDKDIHTDDKDIHTGNEAIRTDDGLLSGTRRHTVRSPPEASYVFSKGGGCTVRGS